MLFEEANTLFFLSKQRRTFVAIDGYEEPCILGYTAM
jgi:hypothetical protein